MESYEEYCGGEEGVISAIDLDLVTLGHVSAILLSYTHHTHTHTHTHAHTHTLLSPR